MYLHVSSTQYHPHNILGDRTEGCIVNPLDRASRMPSSLEWSGKLLHINVMEYEDQGPIEFPGGK